MHASLTRVANSPDLFFCVCVCATIMRRKNWPLVRSCWQLSSSASMLAAEGGMAARVGGWKMALDCGAGCFQLSHLLHNLHRFPQSWEWQPVGQTKKSAASPCPPSPFTWSGREREAQENVYWMPRIRVFSHLPPFACNQILGGKKVRWEKE